MTSFAFILGVLPLVFATGAGAASRNSVGTTVFGGMIVSTVSESVLHSGALRHREVAAGAEPASRYSGTRLSVIGSEVVPQPGWRMAGSV